jgi:beta-glucosidase
MHVYYWAIAVFFSTSTYCQKSWITNALSCAASKTYFAQYLVQRLSNNDPIITIPQQLPSSQEIAHRIQRAVTNAYQDSYFVWGASTAEHQCSTQCTPTACSYSRYAQAQNFPQASDHLTMNFWTNYKSYIDYAHDVLGMTGLRISIEWALVQPSGPDNWDQQVLDHYADLICYLIQKDMTPIICLHHYTDPCWYIDCGGFEKEENSNYFVNYCDKVYRIVMQELIKRKVSIQHAPLWTTYVSPEGYAFKGYHLMDNPPANPEKKGLGWVAQVLKNMCIAHVYIHEKIHTSYTQFSLSEQDIIKKPCVGFLKNVHQLDPAMATWQQYMMSPLSRLVCSVGDMFQNECIFNFFTTGVFQIQLPGIINIRYENSKASRALDFIGLNYYSNKYMFGGSNIIVNDPLTQTDNVNYHIYPQGLYRAIAQLSSRLANPLHIPIYVTENGIATLDDVKRTRFYHSYMYSLMRAIEDGYPVKGYCTWTLADNYEWPSHINKSRRFYGLCTVNEQDPAQLQLKEGSQIYIDIVKAYGCK